MEAILKFIGGIVVSGALIGCSGAGQVDSGGVRGIIAPHHDLVWEYIDEFYSEVAIEISDEVETVILLSPNHYDMGNDQIQSAYSVDLEVEVDKEVVKALEEANVVSVEGIAFEREHGQMVHFKRIEKYLPDKKVVPIVLKWKTDKERLDDLVRELNVLMDLDKALVIASIDFSHYVSEETALKNDQRTQDWLLDWDEGLESADFDDSWGLEKTFVMDSKKGTAMDSPETFYVFTSLLGKVKEVEIWNRTSSASLTGEIDPLQNTSHIFVKVW